MSGVCGIEHVVVVVIGHLAKVSLRYVYSRLYSLS